MDRVGGYLSYLALTENARAYDDVRLLMRAEGQAQLIRNAGRGA
jgi:hypothetical protein